MNVRWHLSHARGYLELGMVAEAAAELSQLGPDEHGTLEFLGLRVAILQEQKKWPALRAAAAEFVRRQPDLAGGWITWAYATRRAESLAAAERILLEAVQLHPDEATIHFNLGCYACQRGDLDAARIRVDRAIALDENFRAAAGTDPDLAPLRATPAADGPPKD